MAEILNELKNSVPREPPQSQGSQASPDSQEIEMAEILLSLNEVNFGDPQNKIKENYDIMGTCSKSNMLLESIPKVIGYWNLFPNWDVMTLNEEFCKPLRHTVHSRNNIPLFDSNMQS
ncbi:hypothetical protein TNIN_249931 [Trichonephila inaurata madagascariensis]|uniref:Uncharacterized protein n=1 Tax=Trichonephila inaurata madagascariensis TaxID=2747483 RepID=A0A8X6XSM4_9ARAC|nr:hypothetical protein TNIN_249931 [Trichonephila inaurata madagascariensis]